jgi:ribosome maturation factor RimP
MINLNEITSIIDEKLRFMQLFLHDIKFIRAGKRGILRVFIDKPGGVTIDDCERASNAISVLLDVENFSDQPYTLEISSPGLDRTLHSEKDYRMVIGHYLKIVTRDDKEICKDMIGKLVSCDKDEITLDMDDDSTVSLPLSDIVSAKVDVRFK